MSVFVDDGTNFGSINDTAVQQFRIWNRNGLEFICTDYGATIMSVIAKNRNGLMEEITLCYKSLPELASNKNPYYGCTVGRVANRISKGKLQVNQENIQLAINNGPNHLHGGPNGLHKRIWSSRRIIEEQWAGVEFTYLSPDGEENYPGNVEISVIYGLTSSNEITMSYIANTDTITPINLTNHTYWNLSGNLKQPITSHELQLYCNGVIPVNQHSIPLGEVVDVQDTVFDMTAKTLLGSVIPLVSGGGRPGIDHCYVVSDTAERYNRNNTIIDSHINNYKHKYKHKGKKEVALLPLKHMAELVDETSGRCLSIYGTQPGLQVYTGNFLSEDEKEAPHTQHNAICLETQHFPDSVNQPVFPSIMLEPDDTYCHRSVFAFKIIEDV